jgi:putative hydrolases of HD superfamily
MMNTDRLLGLLLEGNQLKRTTRTGWGQRGVPQPESVAAHSFGVVYIALVLAELVDQPIDLAAVLAMAVLHDLPESLTTDVPPSAWRFLPDGTKETAERRAMVTILDKTSVQERFMAWWEQMRQNETPEALLVHDADKLDQYLQAHLYEQQTGNRQLDEFWTTPHRFHFPQAQNVYDHLRRIRTLTVG